MGGFAGRGRLETRLHSSRLPPLLELLPGQSTSGTVSVFRERNHARPSCLIREVEATGKARQEGRKALILCMPLSCQRTRTVKKDDGTEQEEEFTYTHFTYKSNWFVLSQTEGKEYQPPVIPEWNEQKALAALKIERIPFEDLNGNCQGYA